MSVDKLTCGCVVTGGSNARSENGRLVAGVDPTFVSRCEVHVACNSFKMVGNELHPFRIEHTPLWSFSKEWTDADKLRLTILLTSMIRDDILAGQYGIVGRPNVQTLHELLMMNAEELEPYREQLEGFAAEMQKKILGELQ